MDVLSNVATWGDEEFENDDGIQQLVQGLNIKDLSEFGTQFAVQVNEDDALELQTSYGEKEVFPHLNLNCLGSLDDDADEDNSQPTSGAETPFAHLALSMTDLTPNGKVKKRIVSEGYGEVVPENSLVWFHHNSYKENEDVPFDSSYLRGSMVMLRLNSGMCILGLDIGLSTMKCEEMAEFLIHPDYAYGKLGVPPRIDKNATILMKVELKKFVDNAQAMKMGELTEEELKLTPFEEVHKAALSLLQNGNIEFSEQRYQVSSKLYRKALWMLENCDMNSDADDEKNEKARLKLYRNVAVCSNKMNFPKSAITFCQKALALNPSDQKILYHLGVAHLTLSSYDEAKKYAFLAKKYAPHDPDVSLLLQKIERKMQRYNSSAVSFAQNALGLVNNKSSKSNTKSNIPEQVTKSSNDAVALENDNANLTENKISEKRKIIEIEELKNSKEKRENEKLRGESLFPAEALVDDNDHEGEFQREAVSYIQEFSDNPTDRELPLPIGLSYEEEIFFLTQASLYGLRMEKRDEDGTSQIFILK